MGFDTTALEYSPGKNWGEIKILTADKPGKLNIVVK